VTGELEDTLHQICREASVVLSSSTVIEASVFKPGNASMYQNIRGVRYVDLLLSALISVDSYAQACIRGYNSKRPIYDLLYSSVSTAKKMGIDFAIFGTALAHLPLAYSITLSDNVSTLIGKASEVLRSLDEKETEWFSKALFLQTPSYLGRLESMDFREMKERLWDVFLYSAREDSLMRNITNNYKYSIEVYEILKEDKCNSLEKDIQSAFIRVLRENPDGLIYRKYGGRAALEVSAYAGRLHECPTDAELHEFNQYLTSKGYNPGSTADIIALGISLYRLEQWYEKTRSSVRLPLPRGCSRLL